MSDADDSGVVEAEPGPRSPRPTFRAGGAVPLVGEGELIGALAFGSIREPQWSDDLIANAQLVGEVLASALRRRQSEDALRKSEVMKSAILESLASGVAVIDRGGRLLQINTNGRTAPAIRCGCTRTSAATCSHDAGRRTRTATARPDMSSPG
jgi:GAF domain-containing protein